MKLKNEYFQFRLWIQIFRYCWGNIENGPRNYIKINEIFNQQLLFGVSDMKIIFAMTRGNMKKYVTAVCQFRNCFIFNFKLQPYFLRHFWIFINFLEYSNTSRGFGNLIGRLNNTDAQGWTKLIIMYCSALQEIADKDELSDWKTSCHNLVIRNIFSSKLGHCDG